MTRRAEAVFVWASVALVVAVSGGLLALGGCGEGTAGQVCEQPAAADCPSHAGGELAPSSLDVTGVGDGAAWGWVVLVGDRYAGEAGE